MPWVGHEEWPECAQCRIRRPSKDIIAGVCRGGCVRAPDGRFPGEKRPEPPDVPDPPGLAEARARREENGLAPTRAVHDPKRRRCPPESECPQCTPSSPAQLEVAPPVAHQPRRNGHAPH